MKILIAYDGSGYSRTALSDLRLAGLPDKADVLMISVSEIWSPPQTDEINCDARLNTDTFEYFKRHSEQINRNLTEANGILAEAKDKLQTYFPKWTIEAESRQAPPHK
jgi:hypothetical protein